MKFEDSLKQLKDIIKKIENDNTELEEMLLLYEKGVKLFKNCETKLEEASFRIKKITKENNIIEEQDLNINQ